MKIFTLYSLFLALLYSASVSAQGICNPAGNIILYCNYDGGSITINIDENIPDIKIGICSYETIHVTITGTYIDNVTEVRYAGYNGGSSTVTGVDAGIVTILTAPPVTLTDPDGYPYMICAYECDTDYVPGGCNTVDQATAYFLSAFSGSLRYSYMQYPVWTGTYTMSTGGNCCYGASCIIPVDAGQDLAMCEGDSVQLGVTGADTYTWTPAATLSNAEIENPYASPSSTTLYVVTGTADGCTGIDSVEVTVNPQPDATVTVSGAYGEILSSTGTGDYTWLMNGYILSGEINDTLDASHYGSGDYQLIITNSYGCSDTGEIISVVFEGIYNPVRGNIAVFPDPAGDYLNLHLPSSFYAGTMDIYQPDGKRITSLQINTAARADISDLPEGIYYFLLTTEDGLYSGKFVKMK